MYDPNNVSVIQRSRAERKKLGIRRNSTSSKPVVATPPEPEPGRDIVEEILQGVSVVKSDVEDDTKNTDSSRQPETTKKKNTKKKTPKKTSKKKKKTSRGKNVKVDDLNHEELSDLFSSPTAVVDDDDDDE